MESVNTEDITCLKCHPYTCLACLQHHTITQTIATLTHFFFQATFSNYPSFLCYVLYLQHFMFIQN